MALFNRKEQRSAPLLSISNPAVAEYFGLPGGSVSVSETSALGLSAVYRAVSIISGTAAALPLKTYTTDAAGVRTRVPSLFDNPAAAVADVTAYEWVETLLVSLLLHGNAFFVKVHNVAGALIALRYIHPSNVTVAVEGGVKVFRINGHSYTDAQILHIPALSTDGYWGRSVLQIARESFATTISGDKAAGSSFRNGAMASVIVTSDEDVDEADAKVIAESLQSKLSGPQNAGAVAFINRKLSVTPWSVSAVDAQFLESRTFQIDEIARWFGLPPHLLGNMQKSTTWGAGIMEQNHALSRFTLQPWTERIEQRLSALLPDGVFVEFDYAGLLQPTPEKEIELLMSQVTQGFLTLNEARAIRNLPPIEGGDVLRLPPGSAPAAPVESTEGDE